MLYWGVKLTTHGLIATVPAIGTLIAHPAKRYASTITVLAGKLLR